MADSYKPRGIFGLMGEGQGPHAPMGVGTNIGTPLDYNRPKIANSDGSFSTERTITTQMNGKWYNVPTVIDGRPYTPQEVEQYFQMGLLPHVGEYASRDQAVRSAIVRSHFIGRARNEK